MAFPYSLEVQSCLPGSGSPLAAILLMVLAHHEVVFISVFRYICEFVCSFVHLLVLSLCGIKTSG